MKLKLTFDDLTPEQVQEILTKITGTIQTSVSAQPQFNSPAAASIPQMPANDAHVATSTAGNLQETDAEGLPWDKRIHSSSKKKNADGKWARRKNTDEAVYNQVVAELRAGGNGGNSAPSFAGVQPVPNYTPAAPIPPAPMMPPAPQYGAPPIPPAMPPAAPAYNAAPPMPPAQTAYAPPPAPSAPPVQQPQPPQAGGQTISDLFNKIQQMFQSGSADANYINSLTNRLSQRFSVQVTSINDIAGRPDMIADAFALIASDGK